MLSFNTNIGTPIYLDDSTEPAFYIDASSIDFIEKTQKLYEDIEKYAKKSNTKIQKDKKGKPTNAVVFIDSLKKEYDYILSKLDELLGEGVSEKVFKGRYSQVLLANFMEFLRKIIETERESYLSKYKTNNQDNVL